MHRIVSTARRRRYGYHGRQARTTESMRRRSVLHIRHKRQAPHIASPRKNDSNIVSNNHAANIP